MRARGDNLCVGGEQDVGAKALRSVRWYARRWREQRSQTWLPSCRKLSSLAARCWASGPQRWIDIKRNQCHVLTNIFNILTPAIFMAPTTLSQTPLVKDIF